MKKNRKNGLNEMLTCTIRLSKASEYLSATPPTTKYPRPVWLSKATICPVAAPKGIGQRLSEWFGLRNCSRHHLLLDRALHSSAVMRCLNEYTESYIARQAPPIRIERRHSSFSLSEEYYTVVLHRRTQQSTLLALHLSWCNGELSVRVSAPRHLWLSAALRESGHHPLFYTLLLS